MDNELANKHAVSCSHATSPKLLQEYLDGIHLLIGDVIDACEDLSLDNIAVYFQDTAVNDPVLF